MRLPVCRLRHRGDLDRRLHAGHRAGHAGRLSRGAGQGAQLANEGEAGRPDQDQAQRRPSLRSLAHWVTMINSLLHLHKASYTS